MKILKSKEMIFKTYSISTSMLTKINKRSPIVLLIIGVFIGFVNGFWGGGGGMLCVPVLSFLVGLEEKKAHATTIMIMLPLSIASFVMYLIKGIFEWKTLIPAGCGFVAGGLIGAYLLKKANNIIIKLIFSAVILAGAIWVIV